MAEGKAATMRNKGRWQFWFWPVGLIFLPVFGVVAVVDLDGGGGAPHRGVWFGPLMMVLLFFLALALVAWFAHWLTRPGADPSEDITATWEDTPGDPAIQALRERFARGEIDEAEYRRRLAVLMETAPIAREIGED